MVHHLDITLLRHSLTKENEQAKYIGWTDSPLSEKGRSLVLQRKKAYIKTGQFEGNELLVTSDLKRAKETADLLFHSNYLIEAGFKEMNFGIFEGKTYAELKENSAYQTWLKALHTYEIPKGESSQEVKARVLASFEKLLNKMTSKNLSKAVLITHGGVIRHLVQTYSNEAIDFFEIKTPFVGGYRLKFIRKGGVYQCISLQVVPIMEN